METPELHRQALDNVCLQLKVSTQQHSTNKRICGILIIYRSDVSLRCLVHIFLDLHCNLYTLHYEVIKAFAQVKKILALPTGCSPVPSMPSTPSGCICCHRCCSCGCYCCLACDWGRLRQSSLKSLCTACSVSASTLQRRSTLMPQSGPQQSQ